MVRNMEKNGAESGLRCLGIGGIHILCRGNEGLLSTRVLSRRKALPTQCRVNAKALRQEYSWPVGEEW